MTIWLKNIRISINLFYFVLSLESREKSEIEILPFDWLNEPPIISIRVHAFFIRISFKNLRLKNFAKLRII